MPKSLPASDSNVLPIGLILQMKNVTYVRKLSGLTAAHLINSSALPDKLLHPRQQPIILYVRYFINTEIQLLVTILTIQMLTVKIHVCR